jgi:hypothetical protein
LQVITVKQKLKKTKLFIIATTIVLAIIKFNVPGNLKLNLKLIYMKTLNKAIISKAITATLLLKLLLLSAAFGQVPGPVKNIVLVHGAFVDGSGCIETRLSKKQSKCFRSYLALHSEPYS